MRLPNVWFSVLSAICFAGAAHAARPFTLITADEVVAEQRYAATRALEAPPRSPMQPPRIDVVSPAPAGQAVTSPLQIELKFSTSADAHVMPDSFKVKYGLLKIDITDRLRPYATVTDTGLIADHAMIPAGNHRLFLEISDSAGRTTVRQLQFTVN